MTAREVKAADIGIPRFKWRPVKKKTVFDLSSHERARDAIRFGLSVKEPGFNIFVLGPDRAGRLTETLAFIQESQAHLPPADDWVYLNNFARPHRPKPYRLPPGVGRKLRDAMENFVAQVRAALKQTFESDDYQNRVKAAQQRLVKAAQSKMDEISKDADAQGLGIFQGEQGPIVAPSSDKGEPQSLDDVPEDERDRMEDAAEDIVERLNNMNAELATDRAALAETVSGISRDAARNTVELLVEPLTAAFGGHGLTRWFVEMQQDLLDRLRAFGPAVDAQGNPNPEEPPEQRYAVNLLVDNGDAKSPPVILESLPSFENLIGRIQYRPSQTHMETDFTLIRAGALHRANGGVLILRADSLVSEPGSWEALVNSLRDGAIRIEEPHRQNSLPIVGAPSPKAVPLDIKIVLVGSPSIYYAAYSQSSDFQGLFKIKADIDATVPATAADLSIYGSILHARAEKLAGRAVDPGAVGYLLGTAARLNGERNRLTARIELLDDIVAEAHSRAGNGGNLTEADLVAALAERTRRNNRIEVQSQDLIERGTVLISTADSAVGQINALTVRDTGDHAFGTPSRVTARASIGRAGVVNIERQVDMGGPIQQKGVLVLQGYLSGLFASEAPLSFDCSITFEQNYGGVEGDSASMAELIAVLSALAKVPLRQDLAITGSVNQHGDSQAVGGVHHKVEGFFRTCQRRGLTGSQGVIVPDANLDNLVLEDEVATAVAKGDFHVYAVKRVEDAVALLTGLKAGKPNKQGRYPEDSVYGRVAARLDGFDRSLSDREVDRMHRALGKDRD